jgi:hypothetical protein
VKAPKCPLCEHEHWSNQPHVFSEPPVTKKRQRTATGVGGVAIPATNNATNKDSGRVRHTGPKPAVGAIPGGAANDSGVDRVGAGVAKRPAGKRGNKTANRRKRADYNAYQRELMRKRRANPQPKEQS